MRNAIALLFLVASGFTQAQQPAQHSVNGRTNQPAQLQKPYVILISADGFRYDYADKYGASHLQQLRNSGVQAQSMIPSFPSVTFPNHYTVATGLYPSHHGIVYNLFYDRKRGQTYNMGDRKTVEDGTWYGGIPLWVLAEQQGLLAASYFFVGTEAAIQNTYPTYWYTFDDKIPVDTRIAQVVEWLQLPPERRPHLITFYFSQVDHDGHLFGPDAPQTRDAVKEVDEAIGKLTKAVEALHLPVNYIFLADHGMAAVDTVTRMDLTPLIDTSLYRIRGGTTEVNIYAKPGVSTDSLKADIQKAVPSFDLYRKDQLPAAWHYSTADDEYGRIGDWVAVARYPAVFTEGNRRINPGTHGFDPKMKEMHAVFYAWGPAFRKGLTIPSFENIHVYPLVAQLLGLPYTHRIDGRPEVLSPILKK